MMMYVQPILKGKVSRSLHEGSDPEKVTHKGGARAREKTPIPMLIGVERPASVSLSLALLKARQERIF